MKDTKIKGTDVYTKILYVENKVTKNGSKYRLFHLLITIDGQDNVRRIAVFQQTR